MDEKMRILKMVEEGKITAEEAMDLMSALGAEPDSRISMPAQTSYDKKMFRIIVDSTAGDKVNVQFRSEGLKDPEGDGKAAYSGREFEGG